MALLGEGDPDNIPNDAGYIPKLHQKILPDTFLDPILVNKTRPVLTLDEVKRLYSLCDHKIQQDIGAINAGGLQGNILRETSNRIQEVSVIKYKLGEMIDAHV